MKDKKKKTIKTTIVTDKNGHVVVKFKNGGSLNSQTVTDHLLLMLCCKLDIIIELLKK